MLEIPEAVVLSRQITEMTAGKTITTVTPKHTPHKFAWFFGEPEQYDKEMRGKRIGKAYPVAGFVEIEAEDMRILFSEGTNIRYIEPGKSLPKKHQLLIEFDDRSHLAVSVQMYGGMGCYQDGMNQNQYYLVARDKPVPGSPGFTYDYFCQITSAEKLQNKSAKQVLATEQRIPGLGNGILQDILFYAGIHPKRKLNTIDDDEFTSLYDSIGNTIGKMIDGGGRDTEKDLFGNPGGYSTAVSKNTVKHPCTVCGELIEKQAYMGGSIYFCPGCQPL